MPSTHKQKKPIGRAAVLLDRRYFALATEEFKRFEAMLDHPPQDNLRLRRLLQTKPPWER